MNRIESLENVYELTFVSFIELGNKIKQIIEKAGGVVLFEKELQKIRLAYPVKKQQYGFLGIVEFKAKPDLVDLISNSEERIILVLMRNSASQNIN